MVEKSNEDSRSRASQFLSFIVEVLEKNHEFLLKNTKTVYNEVVELINDSIDHIGFFAKNKTWKDDYVRFSMVNYIHHILMPLSYAIYTDLLAANLVACFMELRLMLESLVKCYYADLRYPDETFFQEKINRLEAELQDKSTSKLLQEFGNDAVSLWGKLSMGWFHTKGIVNKFVSEIIEKEDVPAWALAIPMTYTETDLDGIAELHKRIVQFRALLQTAIEDWKSKVANASSM